MSEYSIDDFLGGLVRMKQPLHGYRATSDAVLLAAAIAAQKGEEILDVGLGTGAVSLCVAARIPGVLLTGLEIQEDLAALAQENALLNNCSLNVLKGDVQNPPPELFGKTFHHVMTNPPYFTETPQREGKQHAIAHKENVPLSEWIDFCLKKVRPKGTFTIIHRAERAPEILSLLKERLGGITLVPFWPKAGVKPKRVLIQGVLGSKKPFTLHPGFTMHEQDNTRSMLIEKVMRTGMGLFESSTV